MTTIIVTQEHIQNGQMKSCHYCPVALAARAAGFNVGRVDRGIMILDGNLLDTPTKAAFFIDHFDQGHKVKPFTFQVDSQPASVSHRPQ